MYENRVLKRIIGPRRDKVTGEWRKIHNEELNDLHFLPNNFRVIKEEKNEMGVACSTYGMRRSVYRVLVLKLERKRSLGRPRSIWEDNIKMDIQEVG